MTCPKWQSRGQEEGTTPGQGHSCMGSLPPFSGSCAHTSLLLYQSRRAKSQPQLGEVSFWGRQVLRSQSCLVNHSGRSPQTHSPVVSSTGCDICQQPQRSLDKPFCMMKPL